MGINSFDELCCFVQNLCRRQPSSLSLQGSGLMRLNLSRTATYSSEHSFVNIWGMDCGRISCIALGCYLTGRKQTQSPLCRVFRQMPIRSGILSLFFHVCKKCCLIAALIWKQSNTSEEKSPLNKARQRIYTVRWCCWLRRGGNKEERCTSAAFSVSIIPDAQQYLDISTSGSLWVRIISRDGNRCVSLQSSMHRFICLLIDWRTYLHIIRLPLHHEEEALVLVRTVKCSVPDQLLLSMSSEPQKDVLFTEENLYKRKKKKRVDCQKVLSYEDLTQYCGMGRRFTLTGLSWHLYVTVEGTQCLFGFTL